MQNLTKIRSILLNLCGVAALALTAPAFAQHSGGGGGGGHGGAVAGHGSYGGGYRGGYYGGYRGGYYGGYRGGYYGGRYGYGWGYRGGYWGGGYWWGPWGWGWGGLGLGLYFATLPYYYSTYWYGGIPYYYAGNTYYVYDGTVGQYRTTAPPVGAPDLAAEGGQGSSELISYPKNGQSPDQQATDKYECYKWAVSQLGYDPTTAGGGTVRRDLTDYNRAQTACLEARGYSVK
ncbi:MAG TPA: hypothetical protein VNW05_05565 [Steroidobacteraceae bacterium]|jgi:hypothetical protein|nr:hypothetical protein [Steroidobacteraceae bacterium]